MLSGDSDSHEAFRVTVVGGYYFDSARPCSQDSPVRQEDIGEALGQTTLRRLDPLSQYALYAVEMARRAAGIANETRVGKNAIDGVCVGTAFGAQHTRIRYARRLVQQGLPATNPIDFPDSIDGAPAAHIAIRWGLQGPSLTFVDGAASAANALIAACRQVACGRAERMYVIAGDIFDSFIGRSVASSLNSRASGIACGTYENVYTEQMPGNAILALILQRHSGGFGRGPRVEVVGFHASNSAEATVGPPHLVSDVTTTTATANPADPSGVAKVAGAWLGVAAPIVSQINLCQCGVMDAFARRCKIGNSRFPGLAFVATDQ
jgi:hypothetical protein